MKSIAYLFGKLLFVVVFLTGCFSKDYNKDALTYKVNENRTYNNLNSAINSLSNQLFINNTVKFDGAFERIAISTFTNNDDIKSTSTLGRVISESMINDLHIKGFKIIDLTAKSDLSINKNGIFYLSRNIKELKDKKADIYVLVGTYSKFDYNTLVLNARLLNYETSDVISTARVIYTYKDCSIVDLCEEDKLNIVNGRQ